MFQNTECPTFTRSENWQQAKLVLGGSYYPISTIELAGVSMIAGNVGCSQSVADDAPSYGKKALFHVPVQNLILNQDFC